MIRPLQFDRQPDFLETQERNQLDSEDTQRTAPLYNIIRHEITPAFDRALRLVFRLADKDNDFCLCDRELAELHSDVYGNYLTESDISRIKDVIKEHCKDGIQEAGINIKGFIYMLTMMIQHQKIEVAWTLLEHYGFNEDIQLEVKVDVQKQQNESVELSREAIDTLVGIYNQYAPGGMLSFRQFKSIFCTVSSPPWNIERSDEQAWQEVNRFVEVKEEGIPLASWLAL